MPTSERSILRIASDFTPSPGPRTRAEGKNSAEEFLEKLLLPRFEEASAKGDVLVVDLDGAYGYATSFLEEAFGGLARKKGADLVLKHLEIISREEPYLKDDINTYVREAEGGAQR